jgi:hypothetical protein
MTHRALASLLLAACVVASCAKPASTPPATVSPAESKAAPTEGDAPKRDEGAPKAHDPEPLFTTDVANLTDARRDQLATFGDLGTVSSECDAAEECYTHGKCSLNEDDDQCYARGADCAQTAACRLVGACTRVDYANPVTVGGVDACMPASDADCAQSVACAQEGLCSAISGWSEHTCQARLDVDCAKSVACTRDGRCKALEGACVSEEDAVAACAESDDCTSSGIDCAPIDGRCRNPAGFDCAETTACELHDLCDSVTENMGGVDYVACHVSESSCLESPECAARGICGVEISRDHYNGWYKGGCALEGPTGCDEDYTRSRCVKTNAGCAASARCASHGDCSADSPSDYCHPTEEAHCTQSTNCTKHGFCTLADESSYMVCSN